MRHKKESFPSVRARHQLKQSNNVSPLRPYINRHRSPFLRRNGFVSGGGESLDERRRGQKRRRNGRFFGERHAGEEASEPGVLETQRRNRHQQMERARPYGPQVRAQPRRQGAPQAPPLQTRPRGSPLLWNFHGFYVKIAEQFLVCQLAIYRDFY